MNELLREILAEEILAFDDTRLENMSITAVAVDSDLQRAHVSFDTLAADEEADALVIAALEEHRIVLQRAVGTQARLRRTPELVFHVDESIRSGERIDVILRDLDGGEPRPPDAG